MQIMLYVLDGPNALYIESLIKTILMKSIIKENIKMMRSYPMYCLFRSNVGDVKMMPFMSYIMNIMCILGHKILNRKLKINSMSIKRKRRRSDPVLWQNPLYHQKIRKPKDNTQTPPKTSITQRLRTDLGRSVGVTSHPTGVIKPVYGYPTWRLTATAV